MNTDKPAATDSRNVAGVQQWDIKFTSSSGVEYLRGYGRLQDAVEASKRILKNHAKSGIDELAKCELLKVI